MLILFFVFFFYNWSNSCICVTLLMSCLLMMISCLTNRSFLLSSCKNHKSLVEIVSGTFFVQTIPQLLARNLN